MTKVYLSSTFSDLKEYREAVYHALRQMRYDVIAMEDYLATDHRPLKKCLADVAACDLYVGLFAWRYGYIPSEENPEHKSITELEYRQATQLGKPCLIFLLAEDAPWSPTLMDVVTGESNRGECITALRCELAQGKFVGFFKTSDHLASLVAPALHLWETIKSGSNNPTSSTFMGTKHFETAEREARLRAMIVDHSGFMRDRLESFVGRQVELSEIRRRIAEQLETGGYVTITGQAGQGKSSIIAKLVEERGIENVSFHFIPFNPGPDHQVGLLRNLMAHLILKYDLSDLYVASENRVALKDYFPKVLRELIEKGGREVIFIDGLDQLEEDFSGVRDLSFLPNNPPPGIVFVLGTRPNDTLKPLELLKPRDEYKLPGLSRQDFDLILSRRQVPLERDLADQFYQAMQENALYLDLVAKELQEKGASSPREMITRIANNPENIFSLSMARLKRQPVEWREVLKPILGALLAAREPLSLWQIRHILQLEDDRLRDGIARLGGLVAETGQRQYTLFHLKLRDYLRQDEHSPQKEYIFAADEEEQWHAIFAGWCEKGQLSLIWKDARDLVEQSRREYARRHYVAHLYHARKWQEVFTILDEGTYGQAKERHDLSTRSYIQDLDLGRQAAAWSGWTMEEGIEFLPHLWRYTLLRCSLRSRADQYPLVIFQLLLLLNRESEVLGLAELVTNPFYKVQVLVQTAKHLSNLTTWSSESTQIFLRAHETARLIENIVRRAEALREIAAALTEAQHWEHAERVWSEAEAVARSIENSDRRAEALRALGIALTKTQQWEHTEAVARSIKDSSRRAYVLRGLAIALTKAQHWEHAERVWNEAEVAARSTENSSRRAEALRGLAFALIKVQRWEHAEAVTRSIEDSTQRAEALREIATLSETERWEHAERVWNEAEVVTRSIEDSIQQAKGLRALAIALTKAQHWEHAERIWNEAEAVFRSMEDSTQRAYVLRSLAVALTKAQHWEHAERIWNEAEAVARSIENSFQQASALRGLAIALARVQRWEHAEVVTRSIHDSTQQAEALREIVAALSEAERWEQAEAAARSIQDSGQRVSALGELAFALAEARQWKRAKILCSEAERTLLSREGSFSRVFALRGLAFALIKVQRWEHAETVTRSIEDNTQRAEALRDLAFALTEAQHWEHAERVWNEAEVAARSTENSSRRAEALRGLAFALAEAQRWEHTEVVARSIENATQQAEALRGLAFALARAQRWEHAEAVTRSIEDSTQQAEALKGLAFALNEAQCWEHAERIWNEAEAVFRSIEDNTQRAEALKTLAIALTKAQHWEHAERVWNEAEAAARSIENSGRRAYVLRSLAVALTKAQNWEHAERIWSEAEAVARSIENSFQQASALRGLAIALARVQRWEHAEVVTRSIQDDTQQAEALRSLAIALTEVQRLEQAEAMARSIQDDTQQAKALRGLAFALTKAQNWEHAERIWGEAEAVARSIQDDTQQAETLRSLVTSLAGFQRWEQAEAVAHSIENSVQRGEALRRLAEILLKKNQHELLLRIVQRAWLLAETREYALQLIILALGLVYLKPEIGIEFFKAFRWVDTFLNGGDSKDE